MAQTATCKKSGYLSCVHILIVKPKHQNTPGFQNFARMPLLLATGILIRLWRHRAVFGKYLRSSGYFGVLFSFCALDWCRNYVFIVLNIAFLQDYKQSYPDVMILDPPESIIKVYNRKSMLQEVAALNFHHPQGLE